jgi:carbamate kinase
MPENPLPIVIALGGNAISPPETEGNIAQQFAQTRVTSQALADLVEAGRNMIISHGNGPQVGNAIRRVELSAHEVYTLDLGICVADLQGGMGYMISQCLINELHRRGIQRDVSTIVTSIIVDRFDPAFDDPTKPIGSMLTPERAEQFRRDFNWHIKPMPKGGYRRVVASPQPQEILEINLLRRLVRDGEILIAAGGGGIPTVREEDGRLEGVEAVIDKDLAAALLAREVGALEFFIVTGVPKVFINFGADDEQALDHISLEEARKHLEDGQFPAGSMGPKIQAAIEFLSEQTPGDQRGDARVVICDIDGMRDALAGKAGTTITR